ncbi:hypothetical protein [Acinetobacter sp. ANC 4641]|uniref:hypothetical protein n=1 Tax=Acinetobacter sp. ANC 4641 TaxID=2529847 RepID=UPI00103C9175|nr:hypothetical protein [Acinetobacter sp. ANC 4641]TCB11419.1 hypothetical protein E0H78_07235 [Acinetobacter sp. ANC 4641]
MKKEVIDLIRNNKLKAIAENLDVSDVEKAMQISSKVKAKCESDDHAQAALIWTLRGNDANAVKRSKMALAAHVLERNIEKKPSSSADASMWFCGIVSAMRSRVDSVFGENAFEEIAYNFNQRY